MSNEIPVYPTQIWDGLSRNEARTDIKDDIAPNSEDWNRLVAEVIKLQKHVGTGPLEQAVESPPGVLAFDLTKSKRWEALQLTELSVCFMMGATPGDRFFIRIIQSDLSFATMDWSPTGQVTHFAGGIQPPLTFGEGSIDDFHFIVNNDGSFNGYVFGKDMKPI